MKNFRPVVAVVAAGLLAAVALSALGRAHSPSLPAGISALATDALTRHCGGPNNDYVLAAFRVPSGERVWDAFPGLLASPELKRATVELTVTVYRDGYPGIVFGAPAAARAGVDDRSPDPGTVDICVETVDGSDGISGDPYIVYGDVSVAGSLVADRAGQ